MIPLKACASIAVVILVSLGTASAQAQQNSVGERKDGKRLFERETFGGNGRSCLTCHSVETGNRSLSPFWPESATAVALILVPVVIVDDAAFEYVKSTAAIEPFQFSVECHVDASDSIICKPSDGCID